MKPVDEVLDRVELELWERRKRPMMIFPAPVVVLEWESIFALKLSYISLLFSSSISVETPDSIPSSLPAQITFRDIQRRLRKSIAAKMFV